MKTVAGYTISNFSKIENPRNNWPHRPMIYKGIVNAPYNIKEEDSPYVDWEIEWDELGRCNNPLRDDCYLDIEMLKTDQYNGNTKR